MNRFALIGMSGVGAALATWVLLGCPASMVNDCDNGACESGDASSVDGSTPGDGGPGVTDGTTGVVEGGTTDAPAGCSLASDPTNSACVNDSVGIFVDHGGSDSNPGTKAKPVATITQALSLANMQNSVVFVCAGTYAEHVVLDKPVELYGGFACGTWAKGGGASIVYPTDVGYALDVKSVTKSYAAGGAIRIQNLEFDAPDGTAASVNSIAVRVVSSAVAFTGVTAKGGVGYQGANGDPGVTGTVTNLAAIGDINGYNAGSLSAAGPFKTCVCSSGGSSSGGDGGAPASDGIAGGPAIPENPLGMNKDGKGGMAALAGVNCATGLGHDGADAKDAMPASKSSLTGSVNMNVWVPTKGADGLAGGPGQGGGGGGGRMGPGGGGGCGGCGGTGGKGGGGGGASVGVFSLDSNVTFGGGLASASAGGTGGTGGGGGAGRTTASFGGNGIAGGCQAGGGGKGGSGGPGAGGAGGLSVGVLYRGSAPTASAGTTFKHADVAAGGGTGGAAGTNDGPVGLVADTMAIP